jgi:type IV secretory pathway TrbF-like protein
MVVVSGLNEAENHVYNLRTPNSDWRVVGMLCLLLAAGFIGLLVICLFPSLAAVQVFLERDSSVTVTEHVALSQLRGLR